jgi:hypothetical protein
VTDYARLLNAIEKNTMIEAPPASSTTLLTATRRTQRALWAAFLCALSAHGATDLLGMGSDGLVMAPPADEASSKPVREDQLIVSVFPRHYSERYALEGDEPPIHLRVLGLVIASRLTAAVLRREGLEHVIRRGEQMRDREGGLNSALASQFLPPSSGIMEYGATDERLLHFRLELVERFLEERAGQRFEREIP